MMLIGHMDTGTPPPSLPSSTFPIPLWALSLSLSHRKVHTIRFNASLVADSRIPCPGFADPCNDPRSAFFMYIHYMYIKDDLLMLVAQPTVHMRRLLPHRPLTPPRHLPPCPHTSMAAFSGSLLYFKVCTIRFKASLVPDGHIACPCVAEPHSSPRSAFFTYVCYMGIPYTF